MSPGCIRGRFCWPQVKHSACLSWRLWAGSTLMLHYSSPWLTATWPHHSPFSLFKPSRTFGAAYHPLPGCQSPAKMQGPPLAVLTTHPPTHPSMPSACPSSPCSQHHHLSFLSFWACTLTLTLLLMSAQFFLPGFHQWKTGPFQGLSQNFFFFFFFRVIVDVQYS